MQHEIEHILLENYPNPPPPGYPYPSLPHIIQLNDNKSNKKCCFENFDEMKSGSTEENKNEQRSAYVISIDEPIILTSDIEDYVIAKATSHKVLEEIIEELEITFVQKHYIEEISTKQEKKVSLEEKHEAEKLYENVESSKVESVLENNDMKCFTKETTQQINHMNDNRTVNEDSVLNENEILYHKFLEYPNPPPFGFVHLSLPKIIPCDIITTKVICNTKLESVDDSTSRTLEEIEMNADNDMSSGESSTIVQDIIDLKQSVITSQPNADYIPKRFSEKSDAPLPMDFGEKRIKTTVCCCIKI